jgi:hypothetical protein
VPSVWPAAVVQVPVQQSALVAHESPACPQNDDGWQAPFTHRLEQQSALPMHPLPSVLHVPLRDVHTLPIQVWLQQSPFVVQAFPSEVHAG